MLQSDYVFVRQCPNKDGSITPVAYMLPEYYPDADGAELIHKSTSACHVSQWPGLADALAAKAKQKSMVGFKAKRYVGVDVLLAVEA